MDWNFIANDAGELARIGNVLFTASNQKLLDEQVQMTRLLEAVSSASILDYQLRIRHSGENEIPDFQLESGGWRIAVELAKVAVQDVEHARGLQRKGLNRTLSISSLYRRQLRPRTKDEVVTETISTPAMVFPVTITEHNEIWADAVTVQLQEKTSCLSKAQFRHGDEDWLSLWDRIGAADWEVEARIEHLTNQLKSFWKPGWFSRVFFHEEHLQRLWVFTAEKHVPLEICYTD